MYSPELAIELLNRFSFFVQKHKWSFGVLSLQKPDFSVERLNKSCFREEASIVL